MPALLPVAANYQLVDARPARLLDMEGAVRRYLDTALDVGRAAVEELLASLADSKFDREEANTR